MYADYYKIIQSINFFARSMEGRKASKLHFLKFMFLADRYHLRMYGRLISNDTYVAMEYGPVPSASKSAFEFINLPEEYQAYASAFLRTQGDHWVTSLKEVDADVFSETDIEALQCAMDAYKKNQHRIVAYTHGFPEWSCHEQELQQRNVVPMPFEDFFSMKERDYCPASEERLKLNLTHFQEMRDLY